MSDEELIEWLRDLAAVLGKEAFRIAANRIEALTEERDNTVADLEAKLAKAVGALEEWDDLIRYQYSGSRAAMSDLTYAMQRGYATLAEIKGESHE